MAGGQCGGNARGEGGSVGSAGRAAASAALHRLSDVRRQEGISRRTVARSLGITVSEVKVQEQATTDLPLSTLYKWQQVLKVPLDELLTEPDDSLSLPLVKRAQMVQIMKTAMSIIQQAKRASLKRLAQTMVDQLVEIMPELREINPWPLVGKRRRCDEYGRVAERSVPEETFSRLAQDAAWGEWT